MGMLRRLKTTDFWRDALLGSCSLSFDTFCLIEGTHRSNPIFTKGANLFLCKLPKPMKTLLAAVVLLAMVGIGASAQIVQNGDFSQHITAFNAAFPGYSTGDFFTNPFPPYSTPTDPGPIPHWSSTATFQGTGVNSSVNNAFEPTALAQAGIRRTLHSSKAPIR